MGNRLVAFVSRPVRDFNIENRVERAIGVEKPKAAPRHPSDAKYERTKAADTSVVQEKREDLLERLRSVKVVSSLGPQGGHTFRVQPRGLVFGSSSSYLVHDGEKLWLGPRGFCGEFRSQI
uniref:NADH dehydrogenase [ubiquinone] 1 alpha subcomplex assembly factor 4 n=1 Tax=Rhipicephalus appendiculatus TaxID=34631 RepID=A0A131YHU9_RHIAP